MICARCGLPALFVCERAERLEEYTSGSFVGLGRSRECALKFSLGHGLAVAYGSGMAPFQENRSRFHSLLTILIRHVCIRKRSSGANLRS